MDRDTLQCLKDLEAETGFANYVEYLEAWMENRPDLQTLHARLIIYPSIWPDIDRDKLRHCCLIDVSRDGDLGERGDLDRNGSTGAELLLALRSPPKQVRIQIAMWISPRRMQLNPEAIYALGLGLKLDPRFFECLASKEGGFSVSRNAPGYNLIQDKYLETCFTLDEAKADAEICLGWSDGDDRKPGYIAIDNYVVAVSRHSGLRGRGAAPVVLIAGMSGPEDVDDDECTHERFEQLLHQDDGDIPPMIRPNAQATRSKGQSSQFISGVCAWSDTFANELRRLLERSLKDVEADSILICQCLIPLLRLETLKIRAKFRLVRTLLLRLQSHDLAGGYETARESQAECTNELSKGRFSLRRLSEGAEHREQNLAHFLNSEGGMYLLEDAIYKELEAASKLARRDAFRLDVEVRDYMQLQGGRMALEESKASIVLANQQIEEGKRVTILAFVYIPLNLATSIFGMNIKELNKSGPNVWVFVLTASVALLLTAGGWFFVEEKNSYRSWKAQGQKVTEKNVKLQYSLGTRLIMLAWLVWNGQGRWAWDTGAWLDILTNNSRLPYVEGVSKSESRHPHDPRYMPAGDYVTRFYWLSQSQWLLFGDGRHTAWPSNVSWRAPRGFVGGTNTTESARA